MPVACSAGATKVKGMGRQLQATHKDARADFSRRLQRIEGEISRDQISRKEKSSFEERRALSIYIYHV